MLLSSSDKDVTLLGVKRLNLISWTCSEKLEVAAWTNALRRAVKHTQGLLGCIQLD